MMRFIIYPNLPIIPQTKNPPKSGV